MIKIGLNGYLKKGEGLWLKGLSKGRLKQQGKKNSPFNEQHILHTIFLNNFSDIKCGNISENDQSFIFQLNPI